MIITLPDKLSKYIWLNGELIDSVKANTHLLTHSLHYSGAVYEGERAYNGKIFKLQEHTTRLLKSSELMQLKVPFSLDEIISAHKLFIDKNEIVDAYVRPLIFRGCESLNMYNSMLSVNLVIIAVHSAETKTNSSFDLHISRWRKPASNAFPPQVKASGHYNMIIVAQAEAKAQGFHDAVMLDPDGFIAECTTANIFFVKEQTLYTPIADTFLNGITRQTIIKIASLNNIETLEQRLTINQIEEFDECFITGTAAEIKLVNSINIGNKIINFKKSNITKFLTDEYAKLVRE